MALGAQHASPCAPGRRRARIALETQPLPAALPAAVLRIALGLSITQRAAGADAVPTAQTARSALQPRTQCPVAHARRCGGTVKVDSPPRASGRDSTWGPEPPGR